jgi:hypothetical protein
MGRLKFYAGIIGLGLLFFGLKGSWDWVSSEKEPFKMTLEEVEKNGVGNHKYIQVTDAYTMGNFVYEYSSKHGIKGNVTSVIYPVVSLTKMVNFYSDTDGTSKLKASVVVKSSVSFPVNQINTYSLDTGKTVVEGMVRSGFEGMSMEDKNLLKGGDMELENNFIYLVKEKPEPIGLLLVTIVLGLLFLYFAISGFLKKKAPLAESTASSTPTP